jgi:predicted RNA-binding protein with TRAM domain
LLQLTEEERGENQMDYRAYGAPVEEGKQYEVDIKELSRRGDGVARIEGFVIFVPNAKPGDRLKIKIMQVRDRFAIGEKAE